MRLTAYQDATRKGQPTLGDLIDVIDTLIKTPGVTRDTPLDHLVLKPYVPEGLDMRGARRVVEQPEVPGRVGVKLEWTS